MLLGFGAIMKEISKSSVSLHYPRKSVLIRPIRVPTMEAWAETDLSHIIPSKVSKWSMPRGTMIIT